MSTRQGLINAIQGQKFAIGSDCKFESKTPHRCNRRSCTCTGQVGKESLAREEAFTPVPQGHDSAAQQRQSAGFGNGAKSDSVHREVNEVAGRRSASHHDLADSAEIESDMLNFASAIGAIQSECLTSERFPARTKGIGGKSRCRAPVDDVKTDVRYRRGEQHL